IVIERKGLTRMDAILEDGTRIEAAPLKLLDPNVRKEQRMERGDRFVVIGARNDEKIGLTLAGNGLAGQVLIITAERIHSLPLPNEASWKRSVTASENGLLTK
ncbi:MAG: hypothetical protein K8T89_06530, partial [Planctomycetes bacterium]|nr:hypothetical protein [Planctomycetota bacterium]